MSDIIVHKTFHINEHDEVEILQFYDEDLQDYDKHVSVFEQTEIDGGWDGQEVNTFEDVEEAIKWVRQEYNIGNISEKVYDKIRRKIK